MRETVPAPTHPTTDNFNQRLSTALQVAKDKSWPVVKALLAGGKILADITIETIEGAALGYQIVMLIAYAPKNAKHWEYAFPASGLVLTFAIQSLELFTHLISRKAFRDYCEYKQRFAGALDGANFAQAFMPTNNWGVVGGGASLATLFSSKLILDHYNYKDFFHTVQGKFVKNSAEAFYMLMMGAGICGLLFQIITGFDQNVGPLANWSATIGFALFSFLAFFFKAASEANTKIHRSAQIAFSGLYGMSLGIFFSIMLFDLVMDIRQNPVFSDDQFWWINGSAIVFGFLIAIKKFFSDLSEEHDNELDNIEAHALEINHDGYEVITEPVDKGRCLQSFQQCWATIWHCKTSERDDNLLLPRADRSCSERINSWVRPITNLGGFGYRPAMSSAEEERYHQDLRALPNNTPSTDEDDCYIKRV